MQKKLNEDFIESFSEQFAAKISDDFFVSKSFINGQEILSISPSKQVNFFVIKLLFNNWQLESQRLESPFFDYTAPDVKEAMLQFMNVLSRHIKVGRKEFEVLMQDAVRDTLFLIMAPNVYMEIEMDRRGTEELTEKTAKNILKYLKISKDEFSGYLLANIGLDRDEINIDDDTISEDQLMNEIALLNEVVPITIQLLEEGEEEEPETGVDLEGEDEDAILNVEPEDIFKSTDTQDSEPSDKEEISEELEEVEESQPETQSEELTEEELNPKNITKEEDPSSEIDDTYTPEIDETDTPEEPGVDEIETEQTAEAEDLEEEIDTEQAPDEEDSEVSEAEIPKDEISNEESSDDEQVDIAIDVEETTVVTSMWDIRATSENFEDEDEDEEEPSGEVESKEVITNIDPDDDEDDEDDDSLNSKFEDPTSPTSIAEAHENQVDSMMNAISLNQRFMFINELFDGDPEIFKESIDMVDECSSFDESVEKLVQNYARDFHWDMNSEEVKEFLKIIFRRFR